MATVAGKSYILELKNRKTISLPEFWREATVEAENYAKARSLETAPPAYIILKRRNAGIEQAWVIQDLEGPLARPGHMVHQVNVDFQVSAEKKETLATLV
jgi:hypothetical protein